MTGAADDEDLFLDALASAAKALGVAAPSVASGKGKAYEAWLLLELLSKVSKSPLRYVIRAPDDRPTSVIRLPGGPANMPAHTTTGVHAYTHILIGDQFGATEVHAGIRCEGISGAAHEFDVISIPPEEGEFCRKAGGGVYRGRLRGALELKAYATEKKLPQVYPRALLGIVTDIDPAWTISHFAALTHAGTFYPFVRASRLRAGLITTTVLYDNSRDLLHHHGFLIGEKVTPGSIAIVADIFDMLHDF